MHRPVRVRPRRQGAARRRVEWPEELRQAVAEIETLPVELQVVIIRIWRELLRGCRIAQRLQRARGGDAATTVAFMRALDKTRQALEDS